MAKKVQVNLALCDVNSQCVEQDDVQAHYWIECAAQQGHERASECRQQEGEQREGILRAQAGVKSHL